MSRHGLNEPADTGRVDAKPTRVVLARVLFGVFGGYGLTVALSILVALAFAPVLGRVEATVLATMLGFLVYLVVLLWAFSERRLWRLCLVTLAGTVFALALSSYWPGMA